MSNSFKFFFSLVLASLLSGPWVFAADETPTASEDGLEVEKLKLQIEELKLENQRLQLQIKTMQVETPSVNATTLPSTPTPTPTPEDKGGKKIAKDMQEKARVLSEQNVSDEHKVVLDFSNGEIWFKGIRYSMNDLKDLYEDQHWDVKGKFVKYDISGDSMYRYQYHNLYLDQYTMLDRGVFVFEPPQGDSDFSFITPETVSNTSGFADFRNKFETAYFTFSQERKEDDLRVLRFRHPAGFLGFDDVLEFWFDKKDNLVKLKWGMLDKK